MTHAPAGIRSSGPGEKQRGAELRVVIRAVTIRVVQRGDVDFARAQAHLRQRDMRVTALLYADHSPRDPFADQLDGDICERSRCDLIDRIRLATAQVVGQVADHRLLSRAILYL